MKQMSPCSNPQVGNCLSAFMSLVYMLDIITEIPNRKPGWCTLGNICVHHCWVESILTLSHYCSSLLRWKSRHEPFWHLQPVGVCDHWQAPNTVCHYCVHFACLCLPLRFVCSQPACRLEGCLNDDGWIGLVFWLLLKYCLLPGWEGSWMGPSGSKDSISQGKWRVCIIWALSAFLAFSSLPPFLLFLFPLSTAQWYDGSPQFSLTSFENFWLLFYI